MPEISFSGLDSLELSMKEIAEIPDDVKDEMLQAQAAVVVPVMRARAQAYGLKDTGLMIDSIKLHDTPTVIGCMVFVSVMVSVINLLVDLLYALIDPRIKAQYLKGGKK